MKIISYSDIHLEFPKGLAVPEGADADLMILSGDVVNMRKPDPLAHFLEAWQKPVLFVPGNHEYYTERPMGTENDLFRKWLGDHLPNVTLLVDEAVSFQCVNFFGGTMWTDYAGGDETAMSEAQKCMPDYELIRTNDNRRLTPEDTIKLHDIFKERLIAWLEADLKGPRVVITHHAPVRHPDSIYAGSVMTPAFNSLDMTEVIGKYQPDFWFYGHTHECDRQNVGRTQIISNQLGYEGRNGYYECTGKFSAEGLPVLIAQETGQSGGSK